MSDPKTPSQKALLQVKHLIRDAGLEMPSNEAFREWRECLEDADYEEEPVRGEKIYAVRIRPQSAGAQAVYGDAMLQLCEWTDRKDKHHFGITTFYHNANTLFEMGYEERDRLKEFKIEKELETINGKRVISYYPVLTVGDALKEFEEAGILTYQPGSNFFDNRTEAVFLLPDDVFCNVTHEAFCKYISYTGASMLRGGMESTPRHYNEWMMEALGEKEFGAYIDHSGMLYDNTAKAMAVIRDSCGIAMLNSNSTSSEEKAFLSALYDKNGLDVREDLRQKFLMPISNVLKRNLLDERWGAYYASRLAHFLNDYGPMEHARKKNNIISFKPHVLRGMVFCVKEAQEARTKIENGTLPDDGEE